MTNTFEIVAFHSSSKRDQFGFHFQVFHKSSWLWHQECLCDERVTSKYNSLRVSNSVWTNFKSNLSPTFPDFCTYFTHFSIWQPLLFSPLKPLPLESLWTSCLICAIACLLGTWYLVLDGTITCSFRNSITYVKLVPFTIFLLLFYLQVLYATSYTQNIVHTTNKGVRTSCTL